MKGTNKTASMLIVVTFVYALALAYVVGYEDGIYSQEGALKQYAYETLGIVVDYGPHWYPMALPLVLVGFVLAAMWAVFLLKRKKS